MAQLKSTNITGNLSVTGNVLASKIIKLGGTADEILCADGSTTTLSGLGAGTVTSVGISNGGGLTISGSPITSAGTITVGHSNSVTAVTNNGFLKFKYDVHGHITGSAAVVKADITNLGIPAENTIYTFEDGTNCFTVTPSGGSAQTVNVTPSIKNNITGSGSNGYIAKFNGTNTITSGPALSSTNTSKFLGENGTWEYPKFIQTRKSKTSSDWYGTSYPMYGFWESNNICKITVDNYFTKVDYAVKDGDGNVITTTYAKKANGIYYVEGNTTGTAGTWTGTNSDITSYYDGLVINYKIGISGGGTTKLNINGLGDKTCYLRGNTKLTTHYAVGTMVLLSYSSTTDAFYAADYDSNDYGVRVYRQTSGYNIDYPILVSRTKTADIATPGTNNSYEAVYAVIANNGANTPTINPHTGVIKSVEYTASGDINGNNIYAANDLGAVTAEFEQLNVTDSLTFDDSNVVTEATQSVIDLGELEISAGPTDTVLNGIQTAGFYRFSRKLSGSSNTNAKQNWLMVVSTYPNNANATVVQSILNFSDSLNIRANVYRRVYNSTKQTWTVSTGSDFATTDDIAGAVKSAGSAQAPASNTKMYLVGTASQNPYGSLSYTDAELCYNPSTNKLTIDDEEVLTTATGTISLGDVGTVSNNSRKANATLDAVKDLGVYSYVGYPSGYGGGDMAHLMYVSNIYSSWIARTHILNGSTIITETSMDGGKTWGSWSRNTLATQAWVTANFAAKCLLEGTKISMADGSQKNIEDIQPGDLVKSINIETGEEINAVVLHLQLKDVKNEMTQLVFEDGSVLKTNGTHDIYNATKGTWVLSDLDLELDDEILKEDGNHVKFIGTYNWIGATKGKLYNFYDIVTSNNCYYADGILCAHNPIRQFTWLNPVMNSYADFIPEYLREIVATYKDENARENDLLDNEEYRKESIQLFIKQRKKEKQLETIKSKLAETDYVTIKSSEGISITPKMQELLNSRSKWREEFNTIEKELQEVYTETNELKFKYSSLQEEVLLPRIDLRRKFFLESCRLGNEHLQDFIDFYKGVNPNGSKANTER